MTNSFFKRFRVPLFIFLISFVLFLANLPSDWNKDVSNGTYRRLMTSGDQVPNSFLPWLMLYKGTVNFDEIIGVIRQLEGGKYRPYFLIPTEEGFKTAYPILPAVMAIPVYALPILLNKIPEMTYHESILKIFVLGRVAGAFYAALSVSLFYLIISEFSKNKKWLYLFTFFYAYGTATWSVSSRGMWQHTFAQFFISIAVLLLIKSLKDKKLIPWLGFILGIAVLARPTALLLAGAISFYVFLKHKNQLVKYIFATLPSVIFMGYYNFVTFGSVLVEGYGARSDFGWNTPLLESLSGYAFSPARSFLFISPPLVLGFIGIYKVYKDKKFEGKYNQILRYLGFGFLISFLMMAKWWAWEGANGFGYRMLSDYLPILGLFSFLIIKRLKPKQLTVIMLLIIYSVFIHGNAVINRKSRCSEEHNWTFYCLSPPARKSKY